MTTLQSNDAKTLGWYTIDQISETEGKLGYKAEETLLRNMNHKQKKEIKNLLVKSTTNGTITIDKITQIIKYYNLASQTSWFLQTKNAQNNSLIDSTL